MPEKWTDAIQAAGPRLRELRRDHDLTLDEVAERTAISASTLSRLESGGRRPSLELLLPLAELYEVTLDELVNAPATGDPRVTLRPRPRDRGTVIPLTTRVGGLQAFKFVLDGGPSEPDPRVHGGYEWLYVLDGRLRLVLGAHDLLLRPGEAAEFDTRTPHWFGSADGRPVEILSLFGRQGERVHLRARPQGRS